MKVLLVLLFLIPNLSWCLTFSNGKQVSNDLTKSISKKYTLNKNNFILPYDVSSGVSEWRLSSRNLGLKHQIQIVSKDEGYPVRDGNLSIRFEVRPGECGGKGEINDCNRNNGKSERAEIASYDEWGKGEMWYAWSLYLEPKFTELNSKSSLKLLQFHSKPDDIYPDQHFSFEAKDGSYTPSNNINKERGLSLSKSEIIGRWNDILMHVNWSYENDGFYKVWANGNLIYNYDGKTLWDKKIRANFKFGIYRNWLEHTWETGSDGGTTIVYFDEIRIGRTKNEVNSNLSMLGEQEYFLKKSEIEVVEEEIAKLKKEVIEDYDIKKSKKIRDLKKKLRKLEYDSTKNN